MEGASSDKEDGGQDTATRPPETEAHIQTDSDIEAKIATVSDQKEAKRLKRSGHLTIKVLLQKRKRKSTLFAPKTMRLYMQHTKSAWLALSDCWFWPKWKETLHFSPQIEDVELEGLTTNICFRLLRNRVSAQQARERKKSYVQDLEIRCQASDQERIQMEQRLKILERENQMLRQVIKNMQVTHNNDDIAM